ncbi:MAG: hypothetical protein AAGC68_14435, partial [Verrucomicrobiota bacterium]
TVWPERSFAFEHLLFLAGFSQLILLSAERVLVNHEKWSSTEGKVRWPWVTGLILLTAATRMTADLVPCTRVSHQIYASMMLIIVFFVWRARRRPTSTKSS